MTNTDFSDEALEVFYRDIKKTLRLSPESSYLSPTQAAYLDGIEIGWQECRRRAEAEIKEWQEDAQELRASAKRLVQEIKNLKARYGTKTHQ